MGARDGNASANRTSITSTISGLYLATGSSLWLRWSDFNATSFDDGLAIDDFRIDAVYAAAPRDPSTSVPDAGITLALFGLSLSGLGLFARRRS